MPAVRPADRRDMRGMARCLQPVVDGRPNSAAFNGRIAGTMVSGDQQDHAVPGRNRALQASIDNSPRPVEIHAVQVDHQIRFDAPGTKPPVPASVERDSRPGSSNRSARRRSPGGAGSRRCHIFYRIINYFCRILIARKRTDCRRDPRPELRLFRVERTHARRCPWAGESAPRPTPTFHPRRLRLQGRRPRMYRSGWVP